MVDQLLLLKMLVWGKNQLPFTIINTKKTNQYQEPMIIVLAPFQGQRIFRNTSQANLQKEQKGNEFPNPPKLQCPNPHKFKQAEEEKYY